MKGISYSYHTYNMVKQNGEKFVRESFESLKGQSDDIMVIDYSSDDNIEEITGDYGFRFFKVDKVKGVPYHDAKLYNKAIYESKYDLFVTVNQDVVYDKDLTKFFLEWYEKNGHKKYFLMLKPKQEFENKTVGGHYGRFGLYYRPLLLKIRGCDERTYVRGGSVMGAHRYMILIMLKVYGLELLYIIKNIHKWHPQRELTRYPNVDIRKALGVGEWTSLKQIASINKNFDEGVKRVVNSYW